MSEKKPLDARSLVRFSMDYVEIRTTRKMGEQNQGFVSDEMDRHLGEHSRTVRATTIDVQEDTTQTADGKVNVPISPVITEPPEDEDYGGLACCSWTKMCETLGNRQGRFIATLRPLRAPLVYALQALKRFELELERSIKSRDSAEDTAKKVTDVIDNINALTTHTKLNIPPEENQMLRGVANELVILQRVIDEVAYTLRNTPSRKPSVSPATQIGKEIRIDSNTVAIKRESNKSSLFSYKPAAFEQQPPPQPDVEKAISPPPVRAQSPLGGYSVKTGPQLDYTVPEIDANLVTTVTRTYDEHSLKERIARNCDRIEHLICFIDQKCERRWWLKDMINFFQLFIKLALFVSASVSVVYHSDITPSIITLVIAVLQGVIELLDQYFVKNKKPEDVKLSVFTGTVKSTTTAFSY
ncbi:unnamed protein product, partial [Mesorhabditis spiculigera]